MFRAAFVFNEQSSEAFSNYNCRHFNFCARLHFKQFHQSFYMRLKNIVLHSVFPKHVHYGA